MIYSWDTPIKVVHVKNPHDIYIGRAFSSFNESIWHNPFHVGKHGIRPDVLKKYREYVLSTPELYTRLHELQGKVLGCWCKPRFSCHGDVLKYLVEAEDTHCLWCGSTSILSKFAEPPYYAVCENHRERVTKIAVRDQGFGLIA